MKFTRLFAALCCATAMMAAHAAGIRTVTVESDGVGPSRSEAIKAAQAEAIARVNGLSLDSRDVVRMKAEITNKSKATKGEEKTDTVAKLREDTERQTTTKTQGSIKSYQVLEEHNDQGEWRVRIEADINKYEADSQSQRLRMAVLDFRQKGPQQSMFASQVNQSMVDYLAGTRHYAVLDRSYQQERLNELKGLMRDDVLTEERARIGNTLGTDYIVTGTVEELYAKNVVKKIPYTNETVRQQDVKVVVSWRVIEAATGQIAASNTIAKRITVNDDNADQGSVGRQIGTSIAETINDIIYPILVLSYNESSKTVVLGQGGSTLKPGTEYRLVKYGPLLKDPYTGETTSREEMDVGVVRISRVSPKNAYGEVVKSDVDLQGAGEREYILRAMTEGEGQTVKTAPKKTSTPAW